MRRFLDRFEICAYGLAGLLLCAVLWGASAQAATLVWSCPAGCGQSDTAACHVGAGWVAPVNTASVVVAASASNSSTGACHVGSTTPGTWFTRATLPGGGSTWVTLASLGLGSSASPVASQIVTLTWTAPTRNSDGTSLTDLTGYIVYQGATVTTLAKVASIPAPVTSYSPLLLPGSYSFAVTATSKSGGESAKSVTVSTTVTAPVVPPTAPTAPTNLKVVPPTVP